MIRRVFQDRTVAGRLLAQALADLSVTPSLVVLALPRGGVPVAREIASELGAPLGVFVVRKLGAPGHEEVAMGAIASGGVRVLNEDVIRSLGISNEVLDDVTWRELRELVRRDELYRTRPSPIVRGGTVVLVDDGIATGATMRAAVQAVRRLGAARVIVAAPVMSADAYQLLSSVADHCACLIAPSEFGSVGEYYVDFGQMSDAEVRRVLTDFADHEAAVAVAH